MEAEQNRLDLLVTATVGSVQACLATVSHEYSVICFVDVPHGSLAETTEMG